MPNLPDERDLEAELHRLYLECGKLGYWARRWYQLFTPGCKNYVGGIRTVRKTLDTGGRSFGMSKVREMNRLDLTVEALVLDSKWKHFFDDSDRAKARRNLATSK
jgi:hypothetical protein